MGSAENPPTRGRARAVARAALRWLPVVVLVAVSVTAAGAVVDLAGPPRSTPSVEEPRPSVPLLSLRRHLDPLAEAAADRSLRDDLDAFVATQPADTCLQVRVDDVSYDHRVTDPQAPASLQKLLTAVAALSELGPEATFETKVFSAPVVDGTVAGNLHLQGGGDPVLSTAAYASTERNQPQIYSDIGALADAVVAAGVRTVTGSVVGDDFRYDHVRYSPAWPSRFIAQGQVGPVSALSVNDAFAYFPDEPGGFGAAADPAAYAASVLDRALRDRGVDIAAPPTSGSTPSGAPLLVSHRSPPMSQVVTQMLRESDNNTAEILLKELGRQRSGEGSFGAGQAAVTAALEEAGVDVSDVNVADGSGLSTQNVVTCAVVVDVLEHEPTSELVEGALAVSGRSGTLARRWVGTDVVGRVRAKTGTLNEVTALAGHADTAGGAEATFALVANVDEGRIRPETVAAQHQLVDALVDYPELPVLDHLRPGVG